MWSTLALTALLTFTSPAQAKQYAASPGGFMMSTNCAGCPKGDTAQLNPQALAWLLSQQESVVRSHYGAYSTFIQLPEEQKDSLNKTMGGMAWTDLNWIYEAQKTFINDKTGQTEVGPALAADSDGTIFAQAVAHETADAANEMLSKKAFLMYMWGMRWENGAKEGQPVEPQVPMVAGIQMTLFTVDTASNTVTMHVWGKGMITTVRKSIATFDLSAVSGAFDPNATLSFEEVAAGAKRSDGKLSVVYDPELNAVIGVE